MKKCSEKSMNIKKSKNTATKSACNQQQQEPNMNANQISIDDISSIGIRYEMRKHGISEIELLGEYGTGDARVGVYEFPNGTRVASSNGDPIWEEADLQAFANLLREIGADDLIR